MLARMDTSGDHVVTEAEFRAGFNKERVMAEMDKDGDGKLSKEELQKGLEEAKKRGGLDVNDSRVGGMENAINNLGMMLKNAGVQLKDYNPTEMIRPDSGPQVAHRGPHNQGRH